MKVITPGHHYQMTSRGTGKPQSIVFESIIRSSDIFSAGIKPHDVEGIVPVHNNSEEQCQIKLSGITPRQVLQTLFEKAEYDHKMSGNHWHFALQSLYREAIHVHDRIANENKATKIETV